MNETPLNNFCLRPWLQSYSTILKACCTKGMVHFYKLSFHTHQVVLTFFQTILSYQQFSKTIDAYLLVLQSSFPGNSLFLVIWSTIDIIKCPNPAQHRHTFSSNIMLLKEEEGWKTLLFISHSRAFLWKSMKPNKMKSSILL